MATPPSSTAIRAAHVLCVSLLFLHVSAKMGNSKDLRSEFSGSVVYEYEKYRVHGLRYSDIRSSNNISAGWKIEPFMRLTAVLYYQALFGDASDHRMALEGQLRSRATRRFSFDTRINLQKDTEMAPDVPKMNYRWQNAFTFML